MNSSRDRARVIGQAIACRVSAGKRGILAGLREENAQAAAKTIGDAGFEVSTTQVDVASREWIRALVHEATAGGRIN